jgi:Tfp pilus assembly protein PilZ
MTLRSSPPCKRRFRRRTVRVLVDYQVGGVVRCEYATTLGAGGMFIESEEPSAKGAMIKVRFRLPSSPALHEIQGRVAWAIGAEAPGSGPSRVPGMGIEFTDAVAAAALARELDRTPDEE